MNLNVKLQQRDPPKMILRAISTNTGVMCIGPEHYLQREHCVFFEVLLAKEPGQERKRLSSTTSAICHDCWQNVRLRLEFSSIAGQPENLSWPCHGTKKI